MSSLGEQTILNYQYLPITEVELHTESQIRSLNSNCMVSTDAIQWNNKMLSLFDSFKSKPSLQKNVIDSHKKSDNKSQKKSDYKESDYQKSDYKKWSKEIQRLCGTHIKLTQIQKIQLFNNATLKTIQNQGQLVLISPKLHALSSKDRKIILQKCLIQ